LRAIWLTTIFSILPGLLDFASPVAANAIFSLTAMALDISYIIPIALRRIFQHHPEVRFKPGPFYLGDGLLGWVVNLNCIVWTLFVSVIFSLPTVLPVTKNTMNYASVITGSVILLAMYAVLFFLPSFFCPDILLSCCYLGLPQDLVLRRVRNWRFFFFESRDD
jgi:Amino acid permease